MKKTKKSVCGLHRFTYNFFIVLALIIMGMIFNTGCSQGNDDEEKNYQLEYVNVGGFDVLKADGNNVQKVLSQYGKQLKNWANGVEEQLDENTKNYLQPYLNAIKNCDYTNIDQSLNTLYNQCDYIIIDLMQSFKLNDIIEHDKVAVDNRDILYSNTFILCEESYRRGGTGKMDTEMSAGYNYWIQRYISHLTDRGKNQNEINNDIYQNNCAAIAAELNTTLSLAVDNLNAEKGLHLTTDHVQQLVNLIMNVSALSNTAVYGKQTTNILFTLNKKVQDAITKNYYSQSQNQGMEF